MYIEITSKTHSVFDAISFYSMNKRTILMNIIIKIKMLVSEIFNSKT